MALTGASGAALCNVLVGPRQATPTPERHAESTCHATIFATLGALVGAINENGVKARHGGSMMTPACRLLIRAHAEEHLVGSGVR